MTLVFVRRILMALAATLTLAACQDVPQGNGNDEGLDDLVEDTADALGELDGQAEDLLDDPEEVD